MRYKPEFNCLIRGILEKFGRLPDVQIRIIHGDMYEIIDTRIHSDRITTLTPEPEDGRPREGSWNPAYRAMSFPVRLGKFVHCARTSYIEVYMDNETVGPDDELPMYLTGK